jgi:hypothetical protein
MSIRYICKPELKLAVVVWDGVVTWDDWHAHLRRMFTDPVYAPIQSQFTDLRFSSISPTISNDQIQMMVDLIVDMRKKISLMKLAIVAGNDWDKPKLVEIALQPLSINSIVFNDLVTACLWLGVDVVKIGRDIQNIRLALRQDM